MEKWFSLVDRALSAGYLLLTFHFYCALLIRAECPSDTINIIKDFWNGNPPSNLLKSIAGTVTYVWMTEKFIQDKLDKGLHCFATNLADDLTTATDILVYKNRTPIADEFTYNLREKDGVLTLHSHGEPDDTQYVITCKDHVTTFWQCKVSSVDGYEPFVGITVDMLHMDTEATKLAVKEGKTTLTKLNLNTGAPLAPCTSDNIKL